MTCNYPMVRSVTCQQFVVLAGRIDSGEPLVRAWKPRDLYTEKDPIDGQRTGLLEGIERQRRTSDEANPSFTIRSTIR